MSETDRHKPMALKSHATGVRFIYQMDLILYFYHHILHIKTGASAWTMHIHGRLAMRRKLCLTPDSE